MKLNEFSAEKFTGSFEDFYKISLENNKEHKRTQNQPKAIVTTLNGFRVLDSAIVHVTEGHNLSVEQWKLITSLLQNNQIIRYEEGKKSSFNGKPVIYELQDGNDLYGVSVEYFNKKAPIIITAFQGNENGIENWFQRNKNVKNKRARQDEAHSLRYRIGMLLERDSNNIITQSQEKVKPLKEENKIYYHGSNYKFTTFDKSKIRENKLGLCFNFTDDYSIAYQYGDNILKVHLDLNNPITAETMKSKWTYKQDNLLAKKLGFPDIKEEDFDDSETFGEVYEIFKMKPEFIELLEEMGYDGIAYPEDHHYGVFEPEQIHIIQNEDFKSLNEMLERYL